MPVGLIAVPSPGATAAWRRQYSCGPVQLAGGADALYDRHLLFDNVVDPADAGARERYEALARSVRDILSQRWVRTEQTYERANAKRAYYLSMEFLIGRSLANNITNLLLSPLVSEAVKRRSFDWAGVLEQEPDAGLGNGGLGRLAACFRATRSRKPWCTAAPTTIPRPANGTRSFRMISGATSGAASSGPGGTATR